MAASISEPGACLRSFIGAVDSGEADAGDPATAERFRVGTVEDYPATRFGDAHQIVRCGQAACNAYCKIEDVEGGKYVAATSFQRKSRDGECTVDLATPETYLRQSDEYSCLTTATAYALEKLGSKHTAQDIDGWLQREPGTLPTSGGMIALKLALLQAGFSLELVQCKDAVRLEDYYREGSTLDYEDFKAAILRLRNWRSVREHFETTYTKAVFLQDMAFRRVAAKDFEPYLQTSQFRYTYDEVTPEVLTHMLTSSVVRATISSHNGETDIYHEVVVEDVRRVAGGTIVLKYFNPAFEFPSRLSEIRARTLSHILLLDLGITLIRRWEGAHQSTSEIEL